jgi:hypothetical protein
MQYTTGLPVDQITLRMRGDQCEGPPGAIVSIDGFPARSIDVVTSAFTDFALPLDPSNGGAAGTHTIEVAFGNNLMNEVCGRYLYLDRFSLREVDPIPPVPAVPGAPSAPARSGAPSTTLDPAVRKACGKARSRRKRLRRRAFQTEREARRAKRLLRAAGGVDKKLLEQYLAKQRRLRRLETRLDHAASDVHLYC